MLLTNYFLVKITIFALSVCGFMVARHIHKHKKPDSAPLVCPMNMDCHGVVHSDYSKFLGIAVEKLGMTSYLLLAFLYLVFIIVPSTMVPATIAIVILIALVAFLFSLYLISVQLFVLKKGCFWCYISSLFCIMIFVLTLLSYNIPLVMQSLIK